MSCTVGCYCAGCLARYQGPKPPAFVYTPRRCFAWCMYKLSAALRYLDKLAFSIGEYADTGRWHNHNRRT